MHAHGLWAVRRRAHLVLGLVRHCQGLQEVLHVLRKDSALRAGCQKTLRSLHLGCCYRLLSRTERCGTRLCSCRWGEKSRAQQAHAGQLGCTQPSGAKAAWQMSSKGRLPASARLHLTGKVPSTSVSEQVHQRACLGQGSA